MRTVPKWNELQLKAMLAISERKLANPDLPYRTVKLYRAYKTTIEKEINRRSKDERTK